MAVQTLEHGNYFRVLENHKKRLGDYEQVHFRKSMVIPPPTQIALTTRRPARTHLVPFDKNTAALYLRQTEGQWLVPHLSRQDAAKALFNKPPGSFIVRSSQKAKFALSLRVSGDDQIVSHFLIHTNPQNFLTIQGSNLPFLSIYDLLAYFCFHKSGGMPCCLRPPQPSEGDLYASSDSSDSEDDVSVVPQPQSGSGGHNKEHSLSDPPPPLPPRTASMSKGVSNEGGRVFSQRPASDQFPIHEEISFDKDQHVAYIESRREAQRRTETSNSMSQSPPSRPKKKKVPPPKPPRTDLMMTGSDSDEEQKEIHGVIRRVSSIVDFTTQQLTNVAAQNSLSRRPFSPLSPSNEPMPPIPKPRLIRRRSKSSEAILDSLGQPRIVGTITGVKPIPPVKARKNAEVSKDPLGSSKVGNGSADISRNRLGSADISRNRLGSAEISRNRLGSADVSRNRLGSADVIMESKRISRQGRASSTKVSSLIQMFETKSPTTSPKAGRRQFQKWTPPSPRRRANAVRDMSPDPPDFLSQMSLPSRPPKPRITPPPIPPKPLNSSENEPPIVPPRTPVPLLPPKPPGSKPPLILPRLGHRRSLSDSTSLSREDTPPQVPPKTKLYATPYATVGSPPKTGDSRPTSASKGDSHYEPIEFYGMGKRQRDHGDWVMLPDVSASGSTNNNSQSLETGGSVSNKSKWRSKPFWAKKLLSAPLKPQFHRKPRKRVKKFIVNLAGDTNQEFGKKIAEFITEMKSRSTDPHQKMLPEIRNFITAMHNHLLQHHRPGLVNCGMESCDNFEHVVETSLQQCILQPLSHYVYLRIEEYYANNGDLFQVQRSIHQGKQKEPEDMGIRKHLVVPSDKVMTEIGDIFSRMMKTYCAISKLEYLLEAVRITYENVKDSKHPKKPMNDLGADDFLPLFVWVLVQCGFYRAEIEAEYMWGLAHPSLFNGEGGYYLTTLTSAVNVLKELTQPPAQPMPLPQQLPTMNNLQTELKVFFEDENTGQYSSAYHLPSVPDITAAEICDIIADRHRVPNPERYGLFTVENGVATLIDDKEKPQEIILQWTLERSLQQSTTVATTTPSTKQFIAYKRRALPEVT